MICLLLLCSLGRWRNDENHPEVFRMLFPALTWSPSMSPSKRWLVARCPTWLACLICPNCQRWIKSYGFRTCFVLQTQHNTVTIATIYNLLSASQWAIGLLFSLFLVVDFVNHLLFLRLFLLLVSRIGGVGTWIPPSGSPCITYKQNTDWCPKELWQWL